MNGFGPNFRLRTIQDFSYLRIDSQLLSSKWLRFYYKDSQKKCASTRIGLSVSKKVGCAGKRNRLKRLLREQFRTGDFRGLGKDILIVVSPRIYKDNKDSSSAEHALLKSSSLLWAKLKK
ncbi:MAG: ribonuclease P protein component [Bacteriovoracaceae bacterium]